MLQIYKFFQFHTYLSVAKATGIKSSVTVKDYIRYLEEAYMVGVLTKYDYKVGEQLKSPQKFNFINSNLSDRLDLLLGVSIVECGLCGISRPMRIGSLLLPDK